MNVFKTTLHPFCNLKWSALAFKSEQEQCNIYNFFSILKQAQVAEGFSKNTLLVIRLSNKPSLGFTSFLKMQLLQEIKKPINHFNHMRLNQQEQTI